MIIYISFVSTAILKNQVTEYYIRKIIKLTKIGDAVTLITRSHEAEYTYVSKLSIHN